MDRRPAGLEDVSTALVLASPMEPNGEAVCFEHLTAGGEPPAKALTVLFTDRPEHRAEQWRRHVGEFPETFVVLASQRPTTTPDGVEVELVDRPGDITGIGVAITEHLTSWPPADRTAFCLDSITAQLQYVEPGAAYQFLRTLTSHLADRNLVGHVHMNPAVHDRETIETFRTLFDGAIEVGEDGPTVTVD